MFRSPVIKLYCKFLMLGVMIAALVVISSAHKKTVSDPCCDACDEIYTSCVEYCNTTEDIKTWMIPACLADCAAARITCRNTCYPQPGPECPVS
jgi:hypothetical protein